MINHRKFKKSSLGGLWEGWESLGGLGVPMVKIILKNMLKIPDG